jgi:hypothetical protein
VISLFFIIVFLFAVGAIFAFFIRMWPIERMKTHLYNLFGATKKNIHTSLTGARITIFIVSYILSILIGWVLSYFILSMGGFFRFSFSDYLMISAVTGIVYSLLMLVMRK